MLEPTNIDEIQEAVLNGDKLIPVAGKTKSALTAVEDSFVRISILGLSGVVEYEPSEFTITVLAGTLLSEVQQVLSDQGQYLPFDPPLATEGATIGGTVAAGLSGPGAYRFGPIRDFLIGVRYVDSHGKVITGGGKVVKNAAGFDIPKFLIGSLGRLGVLVELTFKVFPEPETRSTFSIDARSSQNAVELIAKLSRSPFDLEALDYAADSQLLLGRIAGNAASIEERLVRIDDSLDLPEPITVLNPFEADAFWRQQLDFSWVDPNLALAKYAITPSLIQEFDLQVQAADHRRRYSIGGNTAWVNTPIDFFSTELRQMQGLLIRKPNLDTSIWTNSSQPVSKIQTALKQTMDASDKFPPLYSPA